MPLGLDWLRPPSDKSELRVLTTLDFQIVPFKVDFNPSTSSRQPATVSLLNNDHVSRNAVVLSLQ